MRPRIGVPHIGVYCYTMSARPKQKKKPAAPGPAPASQPAQRNADLPADLPSPPVARPSGRLYISLALQFVLAAAIFRYAATQRRMDADEGHFLSAIRAVHEGLSPCQDFFFQQTPLFPYLYAAAMKLFGYGYESCLWVSVLCGAGLAAITGAYFARRGQSTAAAWLGWALIVANAQMLFWIPTVKNHAMPLFFGAVALWAAAHRPKGRGGAFGWGALAGFAAMWSVGTRLPAAPFAAFAGLWILIRAVSAARPPGAWAGVIGFAAGLLPPGLLVLRSVFPDAWVFYFDVMGFHAIRSGRAGTFGTWASVSRELATLWRQAQWPAMLGLACVAVVLAVERGRRLRRGQRVESFGFPVGPARHADGRDERPRGDFGGITGAASADPARPTDAWLAAGGFGAALLALLPAQTFHQYFMVPLVFFISASAPAWIFLASNPHVAARRSWIGPAVCLAILAGYACFLKNHRERIFGSDWGLDAVREMAAELEAATKPDDVVFSTWQGYTFLAKRRDLPGNENFNARTISEKVTAEQRKRLHVASNADLTRMLLSSSNPPKAIVIGFFAGRNRQVTPFYHNILYGRDPTTGRAVIRKEVQARYEQRKVQQEHELWVLREPAARPGQPRIGQN